MTREILFRGFHEDKNGSITIYVDGRVSKGEWVYGHYNKFRMNEGKPLSHYIQPVKEDQRLGIIQEVIPSTVGQFTGLDDKNGRKIFEGDICKDSLGWVFEVIWDNENARFLGWQKKPRGDTYICYVCRIPNVEVTGTIFDKEVTP